MLYEIRVELNMMKKNLLNRKYALLHVFHMEIIKQFLQPLTTLLKSASDTYSVPFHDLYTHQKTNFASRQFCKNEKCLE